MTLRVLILLIPILWCGIPVDSCLAGVSGNSVVLGATSSGAFQSNINLGRFEDPASSIDDYYGFGSVAVDQNLTYQELTENYPDPAVYPSDPVLASLFHSIDIGTDLELSFSAISTLKALASGSTSSRANTQSGFIDFTITKDSSVISTLSRSSPSKASVSIWDNSSTLIWQASDGTTPFSMVAGLYHIQFQVRSDFVGQSVLSDVTETLNLLLAFTPQSNPGPPPGPTPPPNPEGQIPEPTSAAIFTLAFGLAFRGGRRALCSA